MVGRLTRTPRPDAGALALLATLALAAFAAAPALAAAPRPQPTVFALSPVGSPGPILLQGKPGQVLRGAVTVRNLSAHRVSVTLQRADIDNASNGNADYVTTHVDSTGRWLRLRATTVRLAAHATRQVKYTIRIPRASTGASHYAGIVAVNTAEVVHARAPAQRRHESFTISRIDRQALPITVRLPGPLVRRLALRSVTLNAQPAGAAVVLGLRAGGSDLIESTAIRLRVLRGQRRVFTAVTTLGQLFPGAPLQFRIPWKGVPVAGTYRVVGTIRPRGAPMIRVNANVTVTAAKVRQLPRGTAAATQEPLSRIPGWVWIALATAAALLIIIPLSVWRHARHSGGAPAPGS